MDTPENVSKVFSKNAYLYQEKFMDITLYIEGFDVFINHLPANQAAILDIACGPGNIAQYLLKKKPDAQLLGIDIAPAMLELAAINNPTAQFINFDARFIQQLAGPFNGIMCGFCLPYLTGEEAKKLITDAISLLTNNGVLYVSTMEGNPADSGFRKGSTGDQLFMNYHNIEFFTETFESLNATIIFTDRKHYLHNGVPTTDLIMIAQKPAI